MEEPKRNLMKKVSWLIVAISVLYSVIVRLPDIRAWLRHDPKPGTETNRSSTSSVAKSSENTPPPPPDPPNTAGGPPDVQAEIRSAATPGNGTSPPHMEAAVLMMNAEHVKRWRPGCRGVLLLDGSGLHFTCTANSHKNVEVPLADIASVDDCGIKDTKGHPDHFNIQNTDPEQGERIFHDWLEQARLSNQ